VNAKGVLGWLSLPLTAAGLLGLVVAGPGHADEACQDCHADVSIMVGGKGYLYIDPVQYGRTAHADVGCASCHDSVTSAHPDDKVRPSRAGCGECHDDVEAEYEASVHAANAGCADCHNPHEVRALVATSGTEMNRMCTGCHAEADMVQSHGTWLVQTQLHLSALPCITCHTGSEEYVITFYLEKVEERAGRSPRVTLATAADLGRWLGNRPVEKALDSDGDGVVTVRELKAFNTAARREGLRLWGMMTPEKASHRFETLDNRWDCTFCHASGPGALQQSFVAIPDGLGTYRRIEVQRGAILEALYGAPDLYLVGASRDRTLTIIGLVIAASGLAMPLGHGTLRLLTRKNRREG
jgi:predicted CXXCH cytochrome family protein